MDDEHRKSAELAREWLVSGRCSRDALRAALTAVPAEERDMWWNAVLELEGVFEDTAELPRGCVPYLPCSVDALLRAVELASVQGSDLFVDIGSGMGRALCLVHALTGAHCLGIEIQPGLVAASRELSASMGLTKVSFIEGDAAAATNVFAQGTVFFLYCPFSGERLNRLLDGLEPLAREKPIRICTVDLPLPARDWLKPLASSSLSVAVFQSTLHELSRVEGS